MANEILTDQNTLNEEIVDQDRAYQRTIKTSEVIRTALGHVSWGAIFAGVAMTLVIQLTLSLLGLGIGLSTIEPLSETRPLEGIGIGSVIWWGVSMLISLFIGGWVAARLAGISKPTHGVLHGLITWSVVTLLTFFILTTVVGRVIGGVGNVIGRTMSLAGQTIGPIDLSNIKQEANLLLGQSGRAGEDVRGGTGNGAANMQGSQAAGFDQVIDNLFSGGRATDVVDRETAVNVIMQRTGRSREEANQIVENWIVKYEQTKADVEAKAREAGDAVAEATSKASIYLFFGLILGALAAGLGGKAGEPDEAVVGERRGNGHI